MAFNVAGAARGAAVAWIFAGSALMSCASPCTDDGAVWIMLPPCVSVAVIDADASVTVPGPVVVSVAALVEPALIDALTWPWHSALSWRLELADEHRVR